MKTLLSLALVTVSLLLLGLGAGRAQAAPQEDGLAARVGELERRVAELALANQRLELEAQQNARVFEALAAEGKSLAASVDESENLGFTAGINPQSRVVLLSAFRRLSGQLQKLRAKPVPEKSEG